MSVTTASPDAALTADRGGIRVVVIDDSAVVRGLVARWVNEDPELDVVGRYANGQLAVDDVAKSLPDVAVLDVEMPVMDGMTALPLMLEVHPGLQVIMASTLTRRNAEISLRALTLGAVDYIPKPESNSGITTSTAFRTELIRKIKAVGRSKARFRGKLEARQAGRESALAEPASVAAALPAARPDARILLRSFSPVPPRILVIGSSTGGPQALARVITAIAPAVGRVPVLVTQHMPATFTSILAEHLARASGREAKEGENGEPLRPGVIYVAPGGNHMRIVTKDNGTVLEIYDGPDVNFCKPAVDPLFGSTAEIFGNATLGVVLTGMGHDGAQGAVQIADEGGSIIAQDEATSVVWGMPGATAHAGACAAVLPLDQIAPKIITLLQGDHA